MAVPSTPFPFPGDGSSTYILATLVGIDFANLRSLLGNLNSSKKVFIVDP